MVEAYILRPHSVTEDDKVSIKKAMTMLEDCPICGSHAYISKDVVDGFYFGYSVGCPRFCMNDGIHGVTDDMPESTHLSLHCLDSVEECIAKWNRRAQKIAKARGTGL